MMAWYDLLLSELWQHLDKQHSHIDRGELIAEFDMTENELRYTKFENEKINVIACPFWRCKWHKKFVLHYHCMELSGGEEE